MKIRADIIWKLFVFLLFQIILVNIYVQYLRPPNLTPAIRDKESRKISVDRKELMNIMYWTNLVRSIE